MYDKGLGKARKVLSLIYGRKVVCGSGK